ncbi:hypothetical protein GCM10028862_05490 [Luteimonas pelagia]
MPPMPEDVVWANAGAVARAARSASVRRDARGEVRWDMAKDLMGSGAAKVSGARTGADAGVHRAQEAG